MQVHDVPALILGMTIGTYWLCVIGMTVRVRRNAGRISRLWIPEQRRERLMWLLWLPTLAAWIHMPFPAAIEPAGTDRLSGLAFFAAGNPWFQIFRWIGAIVAVACLGLSIHCWRHMGSRWRMGVDA